MSFPGGMLLLAAQGLVMQLLEISCKRIVHEPEHPAVCSFSAEGDEEGLAKVDPLLLDCSPYNLLGVLVLCGRREQRVI